MAASDESTVDSSPSADVRDAVILTFPREHRRFKSRLGALGLKVLSRVPTSPHSKGSRERREHPSMAHRPPVELHLYRKQVAEP